MFERDSTRGATIRERHTSELEGVAESGMPPEAPVEQAPPGRIIRGWFLRSVAVAAEVTVAFLLRELMAHGHPDFAPFITFYPAVLLASLLDGVWAGIAVTALSTVVAEIWIFPPFGQFAVSDPFDVLSLAIFFLFGVSLSVVVERYHQN